MRFVVVVVLLLGRLLLDGIGDCFCVVGGTRRCYVSI